MLLLYAIAAGLLIGLLNRGSLANLAHVRIRWWTLALGGLIFQLVLFSPPVAGVIGAAGPVLYVGSTAIVLVVLLANVRLPGFWLVGVGALLNLIVVLANGGQMPASAEGFLALYGAAAVPTEAFSNSTLIGPQTVFPLLGDIFVLPRPIPLANVFSIGDVLIAIGGAWFIVRTMRRPAQPAPQRASGTHGEAAGLSPVSAPN
jgi:hypothetical protein